MALLRSIYSLRITVKHVAYAAPAVSTYASPAYTSTYGSHIVSCFLLTVSFCFFLAIYATAVHLRAPSFRHAIKTPISTAFSYNRPKLAMLPHPPSIPPLVQHMRPATWQRPTKWLTRRRLLQPHIMQPHMVRPHTANRYHTRQIHCWAIRATNRVATFHRLIRRPHPPDTMHQVLGEWRGVLKHVNGKANRHSNDSNNPYYSCIFVFLLAWCTSLHKFHICISVTLQHRRS